ncbi:MAG: indole-3-glycerol phosphate synthase TrpC [Oscillospiraceae bacterium]|jgi:indole-3-glycerol phosphate synthase|nr:indole-3-glycerol phosphate synthase TrpC [Oscillospiraceae bacterium]
MTILETLAGAARERVAKAKRLQPLSAVRREAELLQTVTKKIQLPFEAALRKPGLSFICEVKKASPSKGVIADDFPYMQIAEDYRAAGADALSVLTEPTRFLGSDSYLREIAAASPLPCLRKDFTVDEYQIYEAKLLGASAVLCIAALLPEEELRTFMLLAASLGLSVLAEAHDAAEVETVLRAGARIVGVNNRNLKDFTVNIENSICLRKQVPPGILFVSESGIQTPADTRRLMENGTDAVLIGETLMRAQDKAAALRALRNAPIQQSNCEV